MEDSYIFEKNGVVTPHGVVCGVSEIFRELHHDIMQRQNKTLIRSMHQNDPTIMSASPAEYLSLST